MTVNLLTTSEKCDRTTTSCNVELLHLTEDKLFSSKCWWHWKEPVAMCGNLNVRQATSQQLLKVTTFYMDTRFQSFSPLISRIVHHALLKFSPCLNKPLPQLVHVANWYSIHAPASYPRCGNLPDLDQDCWLATCQDWWTGMSHGAEARLCSKHDVLVHCLAQLTQITRSMY